MTADEFEKEYGDEAREYRDKLNIWKKGKKYESKAWEYPSDARQEFKHSHEGATDRGDLLE